MSRKVRPERADAAAKGKDNAAFGAPKDEDILVNDDSNASKLQEIVALQLKATAAQKDWRQYVTKKRREKFSDESTRQSSKGGWSRRSTAHSQLGLEMDLDLFKDESSFTPSSPVNGAILSQPIPEQSERKLNGKLIQHFVMLNDQPHQTAEVDLEHISSLIERGADINCSDRYGQTILHEAARLWHTDVALYLIENGAEVNKCDRYGRTPLHLAAATDYPEMIELLLQKGAKLEALTAGELQTPLHFAARNDAVEACKVLTKCGASVEAEDYKKRSPVHVAAELDRSETARWLVENGAKVGRCDSSGQSCMTHMITKMGPVARDALDTFHKTDRPNRRQYFYLNLLERDMSGYDGTLAKTPLQVIVGYKQLDIIMHPVILKMLELKWLDFGRNGAIRLVLFNFLYILIWTILAVGVPWQTRYEYVLPGPDVWRIIFWILAVFSTLYFVGIEILEIRSSRKRFKHWKDWRIDNIDKDMQYCHPKWPEERDYLEREIQSLDDMVPSYFHDFWNFFDWTVYFLNFCVFITHFVNVAAYNPQNRPAPCCGLQGCDSTSESIQIGNMTALEACAQTNAYVNNASLSVWVNRIFAVNIIMMWLRLMKNMRAFRTLGPFVVMLGKITHDVVRFLFLYFEFYIPYACAFWMIFGGEPSIITMSTVDQMLFSLYRITLVDDYQFDEMHTFDVVMTYILVGTFLGISAILCINLFIALLSDTFQRVYDNANANAVMQQAMLILSIEENLNDKQKERFQRFISNKCSPREEYYDDDLTTSQGEDLKKATIEVRDQMSEVLEYVRSEQKEKQEIDSDIPDGRLSRNASMLEYDLRKTGGRAAIVKLSTDMSNVVTSVRKYQLTKSVQKGNENKIKKMQRDLEEIKMLLTRLVPEPDEHEVRKDIDARQQKSPSPVSFSEPSFPIEVRVLPPNRNYQPGSQAWGGMPRSVEELIRESSAAQHDNMNRLISPTPELQMSLSQRSRSYPSEVEMTILPGSSSRPSSRLQEDSFRQDQPASARTQTPAIVIADPSSSDMGSSNV